MIPALVLPHYTPLPPSPTDAWGAGAPKLRGQGGHMTACAHGMVVLLAGAHGGGECWPIYVGIWLCVC